MSCIHLTSTILHKWTVSCTSQHFTPVSSNQSVSFQMLLTASLAMCTHPSILLLQSYMQQLILHSICPFCSSLQIDLMSHFGNVPDITADILELSETTRAERPQCGNPWFKSHHLEANGAAVFSGIILTLPVIYDVEEVNELNEKGGWGWGGGCRNDCHSNHSALLHRYVTFVSLSPLVLHFFFYCSTQ